MPLAEAGAAVRDTATSRRIAFSSTANEDVLASSAKVKKELAACWEDIVDHKLIEWGQCRNDFEVDGLVGPSNTAILKACKLIEYMRDRNWPLPTGVTADGEGGIVFENRRDPMYQRIEIGEHGVMFLVTFYDCNMQGRPQPIDIE